MTVMLRSLAEIRMEMSLLEMEVQLMTLLLMILPTSTLRTMNATTY